MACIGLIESDHDCRRACAVVLEHLGHEVHAFGILDDAVQSPVGPFEVVVIAPGWEAARCETEISRIHRRLGETALVVLSESHYLVDQPSRSPQVRILPKPFKVQALREALTSLTQSACAN